MAYLGEDVKKLGFGLMRLPKNGDEIDVEQTKKMVDMFLEAGFTYFDTAWAYKGSEEAIKKALVERYPRESYTLATKCAAWLRTETREEAIAQFETSLERSGAGYFDFYLLHNLGTPRTEIFEKWDLWNWALELKEKGQEIPLETVMEEIAQRDYADSHRAVAPLKQADDAVVVDTSALNAEESLQALHTLVKERLSI